MIELKIPRYMRDTIPILEFRNKILWVVGHKRSGYYPVSEKTKKMICFEIKEV
ncbi:MAG: tRNA lysidine(34) synthetase TilS C-terminal domain-containing protein [Persephonella sp.]|nr:tRNA lysidine(34) synthetase TilS C-terminal domain-containing protein [Persephonella sp.]